MERVTLEHPLPEAIKSMARDDTVCKFCGVSYLIHNEIKALEDKLEAAQREIAFYRGIEAREEKLKLQITGLEAEINQFKQDITSKQAALGTLKNDIKTRDGEIKNLEQMKIDSDKRVAELVHNYEQIRLKHNLYTTNLPRIQQQFSEQRTEAMAIKSLVTALNTVLREQVRSIQDHVISILSDKTREVAELQSRLTGLEQNVSDHVTRESDLRSKLGEAEHHLEGLVAMDDKHRQLEAETQQLHTNISDLESRLEKAVSSNRTMSMENEMYTQQIKKHSQEMTQLTSQLKHKEQEVQENINRLTKEMESKDSSLVNLKRALDEVTEKYNKQQREDEEIKRTANANKSHTEQLQDSLDKVTRDITALKKEREMMISAHQNQIEQLRDSFRNRIAEADKWPQRLEEAVRKERQKHVAEISALENKLKESFLMEIQIEKQKQQELLQKYQNDNRLDAAQVKSQIDSLNSDHKSEIALLHKQLAETKARGRETENSLRDEISSLKNIITDLEKRLACLDTGAETKVSELTAQLHSTKSQLNEVTCEKNKLIAQLDTTREENVFLQETVRNECEERFELTEALSQAKEELLHYKRPPGGYGPAQAWAGNNRSGSAGSQTQSEKAPSRPAPQPQGSTTSLSSRSEEIALFKRLASNRPQPPSQPREGGSEREAVTTGSTSIALDTDRAKAPGKGLKGASLSESRRRISTVLGRR